MKPKIIQRDGNWFALLPLADFERLMREGKAKLFPPEISNRLDAGENPIRVFREHRGSTQEALAKTAGIARPYLTELETGKKRGSIEVLRAIASALELELGDII